MRAAVNGVGGALVEEQPTSGEMTGSASGSRSRRAVIGGGRASGDGGGGRWWMALRSGRS